MKARAILGWVLALTVAGVAVWALWSTAGTPPCLGDYGSCRVTWS